MGKINQPTVYPVVIAVQEIPPFTTVAPDAVSVDQQAVNAKVADRYVLVDEWEAMTAEGNVVAIEPLHPGQPLLREGKVFISVKDADKPKVIPAAKALASVGFGVFATEGTAAALAAAALLPVALRSAA